MGGCQNYGPFLDPIFLTTTHIFIHIYRQVDRQTDRQTGGERERERERESCLVLFGKEKGRKLKAECSQGPLKVLSPWGLVLGIVKNNLE